ncbi:MAG: GAF domain-containing protein [SAR202 cluster bacterium]|nr:GAF domain-containing protein [SAR202 cluster bacterium]
MKNRRPTPEFRAVCNAADIMAGRYAYQGKVSRILDAILEGTDAHRGVLRIYDAKDKGIRLVHMSLRDIKHPPIIEIHSPKTGKTGEVFQSGKTLVENDLVKAGVAGVTRDAGLKAMVVVPVKRAGKTIGTVDISSKNLGNWTPSRVRAAEAVTALLAALEGAKA